jgi:carbamoyltransferase
MNVWIGKRSGYNGLMEEREVILAYKEGHDPAAALMINGEIIVAVEEERFTREKHAPSKFPKNSIDYCLQVLSESGLQVTHVVLARRKPILTAVKVFSYYVSHPTLVVFNPAYVLRHLKVQMIGCLEQICGKSRYQLFRKYYPNLPNKILSIDHHLGHAASAYFFSGQDDSLIVTWDGKGEEKSITINIGKAGKLKKIYSWGILSSLGLVYSQITELLGFTPNDGEYKVMGMAAIGEPKFDLRDLFKVEKFNGKNSPINPRWVTKIDSYLKAKDIVIDDASRYNVASSFQFYLEEICILIIKHWITKTKLSNLSIAGGVGLNVKVNQKIWEQIKLTDLFIQPASGDAGLVLGACALVNRKNGRFPIKPLQNMYLGPKYSPTSIKETLEASNLIFHLSDNVAEEAASFIHEGKVIGWFQGRMEFGPRALGNRSILADPTKSNMQEHVNSKIKFREEFRPFCPTVDSTIIEELFKQPKSSPYMTMSFAAKDRVANLIPAVVHVDGTVRPQTLTESANPIFFQVLHELKKLNGSPIVLNTSMNVRGEPMCMSPTDAVNFFLYTNVDVLVIGDFVCEKRMQVNLANKEITENRIKSNY